MAAVPGSTLLHSSLHDRSWSFLAIFAAGFLLLLVLAVAGALLRLNWRAWLPGAEGRGSLLGSVTAAVYSFMSFLP